MACYSFVLICLEVIVSYASVSRNYLLLNCLLHFVDLLVQTTHLVHDVNTLAEKKFPFLFGSAQFKRNPNGNETLLKCRSISKLFQVL